jgi:sugar O-acyltransferase (sialic acid O-acetyltransferase NeuD family)
MKRLAILGASGHGTVVADAALCAGWDAVSFFDDAWPLTASIGHWQVEGTAADLIRRRAEYAGAIIAIGSNTVRLSRHIELRDAGVPMATIVHPAAVVSSLASIAEGTMIVAGAVINPFAIIGAACIVNTSASVDHHCELADGVHVGPGAHLGGNVRVGRGSWIGIGASLKHGIDIGEGVTIGAGAVVLCTVGDDVTAVGVPARPI